VQKNWPANFSPKFLRTMEAEVAPATAAFISAFGIVNPERSLLRPIKSWQEKEPPFLLTRPKIATMRGVGWHQLV
jgi:hypothetical protein